jgi:translocator protein
MKNKDHRINWKLLILCFIVVYIAAFIGSLFTDTGNWYDSIKPSITPPNYVFPIVWTILFFLIALSFYFSMDRALKESRKRKRTVIVYVVNLTLNVFWSYLFFALKSPLAAFINIILLLISIVIMMEVAFSIDKKATYLLIPYLLWVLFATLLNYLIVF